MKTSPKRQFIVLMQILSLVYLVVGLIFFFFPAELIYVVNIVPIVFKLFSPMSASADHFWICLTTSMMVMLSMTAYFSSKEPENKNYVLLHLASKAVSTLGFIYCFFRLNNYWAYALGALTDGSLFILVFVAYIRMMAKKANA